LPENLMDFPELQKNRPNGPGAERLLARKRAIPKSKILRRYLRYEIWNPFISGSKGEPELNGTANFGRLKKDPPNPPLAGGTLHNWSMENKNNIKIKSIFIRAKLKLILILNMPIRANMNITGKLSLKFIRAYMNIMGRLLLKSIRAHMNITGKLLFGLGVAANRRRPCTQGSVRLRRTASRLRDWANPCALRALKHVR